MSKCLKCGLPLPSEGDCAACAHGPAAATPRPPAVPRLLDRELHLDRRRTGARDAAAPRWAVGGPASGAAPAAAFALSDALPTTRNLHADALVADVLDDADVLDFGVDDAPASAAASAFTADLAAAPQPSRLTPPYGLPAAPAPARRPLRERLQAALAGTEPTIAAAEPPRTDGAGPAWAARLEVPPGLVRSTRQTPVPLAEAAPEAPAALVVEQAVEQAEEQPDEQPVEAPAAPDLSWVEAAARSALESPLMIDVTAPRPLDVEEALARDASLADDDAADADAGLLALHAAAGHAEDSELESEALAHDAADLHPDAAAALFAPEDDALPDVEPEAELAAAHPVVAPGLPRPAPLWRRTLAFAIDAATVAGVVGLYLGAAAGVAGAGPRATLATSGLPALLLPGLGLALVLALAYCALSALVGQGRTLGRWLLGLRVVDAEGEAPRPGRALARALLSSVSVGLFLGGIWLALFDRRGQTLHDKLTSTFVVQPS